MEGECEGQLQALCAIVDVRVGDSAGGLRMGRDLRCPGPFRDTPPTGKVSFGGRKDVDWTLTGYFNPALDYHLSLLFVVENEIMVPPPAQRIESVLACFAVIIRN